MTAQPIELPHGVKILPLTSHGDVRGDLTEVFRNEWFSKPHPIQWNFVNTKQHVLRGMRTHRIHHDYYILVHGEESVGLQDLRTHSPTHGKAYLLNFNAKNGLQTLSIPPGVAHGFYAHTNTMTIVGATEYYNAEDELSFRWNDPDLGIVWPNNQPIILEREAHSSSLKSLLSSLEDWQASVTL